MTEPLARLGAHVTAIDISAQSLEVAESRLELPGNELIKNNISYVLASANELASADGEQDCSYKNEQYDAVIMSEVIEHNDDQQALINVSHS